MKKILQFGTFDLNNYGDLLFPLLAKRKLACLPDYHLHACSPIGGAPSELSDTTPCFNFFDERFSDVHGALIGGGNIIHPSPTRHSDYVAARKGNLAYSELWIAPTFLLPEKVPVVWNAPGVPDPFKKPQYSLVKSALQRANYLSVRDEISKQYLLDVWPDADISVVPDSAWAINELWDSDQLKNVYNAIFQRFGIPVPDRTIVFSFNKRYLGSKSISEIAASVTRISRQMSATPILIPLGPCHGDDILSTLVSEQLTIDHIPLNNPQSLCEITACLSSAYAYAGCSMHGLIVASAFGVPGVCIAKPSAAKFSGLIELMQRSDIVVENWDQAEEVLWDMNFNEWSLDLLNICNKNNEALKIHWHDIFKKISKFSPEDHEPSTNSKWQRYKEYQDYAYESLMEVQSIEQKTNEAAYKVNFNTYKKECKDKIKQLQSVNKSLSADVQRLKAEIKKLKAEIKRLKAEIKKRLKRSLSWKITKPLRFFSRRFLVISQFLIKILIGVLRVPKNFLTNKYLIPGQQQLAIEWITPPDIVEKIQNYQKSSKKGEPKIVFYTAIYGDYDTLLLPEVIDDNVDYICFTDSPKNTHGLWQLRMSPYYHPDPVRSARYVKTHPHSLLSNYDFAVWIDANIVLRTNSKKYFDILTLDKTNIGLIPHPHRDCFYQEADACKMLRKDDKEIIDAQVNFYNKNGIEKFTSVFETGFMVINLTDVNVQEMFRIWWQQIAQFSRRDQLGLVWALHQTGVSVSHLLPKGVSVREDNDFRYFTHAQSQQVRIPLALEALKQIESPVCDGSFYDVKEARLSKLQEVAIDIVICVYNAIDDVKLCLEAVNEHLIPSHRVIIVNDCSDRATTDHLRSFADNNDQITLIENEENLGYTKSANVGLTSGVGEFCILLNSDTIVSQNWAVKMLDTAMQIPDIGIVGALSNAAGAQSIPEIHSKGSNTVVNLMPDGVTNSNIDDFLEKISPARNVPLVQLVHGFCIGIKREVIETIGVFDDVNFARYYGEENDYCFRATTAGFSLAIATNTFVFHRKSQSISEEERIIHMDKARKKLRELYGVERIRTACLQSERHPLLEQIRIQVKEYLSNGSSH